jgi:predicted MPP superfamily phosphohydrolase
MFLILTALSWTAAILLYKSSIQSLGYDHSEPIPHVVPYNQLRKARTSSTSDGMFYFVQISDLHISAFQNSLGIDHLKSFLSVELPILSPEKVVVTGDLTDAKSRFQLTSTQFDQGITYLLMK